MALLLAQSKLALPGLPLGSQTPQAVCRQNIPGPEKNLKYHLHSDR
jgi:hypothetical protein